jgi:hypothetical protein
MLNVSTVVWFGTYATVLGVAPHIFERGDRKEEEMDEKKEVKER